MNYNVLKSKSPYFLLKKIHTLIKTKQNWKWKTSPTFLQRQTFCFSSNYNRKLKVKLWWAKARKRKKRKYFVPFIWMKETFFKHFISMHVYWINFQNMHYFTYQKTLLHTLLCLFLKSSKVSSLYLKETEEINLLVLFCVIWADSQVLF